MKKIIIITNLPSPYRIPLFNHLCAALNRLNYQLKIIFLTKAYSRRKWKVHEKDFKFDYVYLDAFKLMFKESFFSLSLPLPKLLFYEKPELIISAGFSPATIWAMLYAKMFKKNIIVWSGETIRQESIRKDFFGFRRKLRAALLRKIDAGIVYGSEAKAYLMMMGMQASDIYVSFNTVNTDFFSKESDKIRMRNQSIKQENNFPTINLLYVGHLTKPKGIDYLFKALKQIQSSRNDIGLHIVGSGPYEEALKKLALQLELKNIFFWGFKQQDELPYYYGICDVFVFPSFYDIWGLVCIEAMAAGLPVLCSKYAGVSTDLIIEGYNGYIIRPDDVNDIAEKIKIITDHSAYRSLSQNARDTIGQKFSLDASVDGFVNCIKYVTDKVKQLP